MKRPFPQSILRRLRALSGNEHGVGLVGIMLAVSLLAVFALVAASLAVNERRTAFFDAVHNRSFMAADSGTEAAIAWLQLRDRPPVISDMATGKIVDTSMSSMLLGNDQGFEFDVRMRRDPVTSVFMTRPRPGYDPNRFLDFVYDVDATGVAGLDGRSDVSVIVTKLTPVNYH